MGIERVNPYNQGLIGLSKKVKAEPDLLETKKMPPDEKNMKKRIIEQEKLKKAAEQMKHERAKMKQAEASMKAEQEEMKILRTCMEISRRIISGDEVPQKDHKYLMKHNMELYARAIMLRKHKENPHKYDQLSEDEETNTPQNAMDIESSSLSENPAPVSKLDVSI